MRTTITITSFLILALFPTRMLAQAPTIAADKLEQIKKSTVLVKVFNEVGEDGTGSGFVIRSTASEAYLATNAHVIGEGKASVQVVFEAGTRLERTIPALILSRDVGRDLAVLKVLGDNFPKGIDPFDVPKVSETLPVVVAGFPFGDQLARGTKNPAITISQATVSSVRRNADNRVTQIQLDGAINPGNSGGPVLTHEGKLVGIAVQTIRGTGIGFAIPNVELRTMLSGRINTPQVEFTGTDPKTHTVKLTLPVTDPLNNITKMTTVWRTAPAGTKYAITEANGQYARLVGKPVDWSGTGASRTAELQVPKEEVAAVWLQIEYWTRDEKDYLLPAMEFPVNGTGLANPATDLVKPTNENSAASASTRPEGAKTTLRDLDRKPERFIGSKVDVEGVIVKSAAGTAQLQPDAALSLTGVRLNLPASLGEQLNERVKKEEATQAVRVRGDVLASEDAADKRPLFEVTEVAILDKSGQVSATLKPVTKTATNIEPKSTPTPSPSPTPTPSVEAKTPPAPAPAPAAVPAPVPTTEAAVEPAPDSAPAKGELPILPLAAAGLVGLIGMTLAILATRKKR
ncbi:MAG: S1C family serine protease [Gemmataceae bacterium]